MRTSSSRPTGGPRFKISHLKSLNAGVKIDGAHVTVASGPKQWWHLARIAPTRPLVFQRWRGPGVVRVTLDVTAGSIGIVLWDRSNTEREVDTANIQAHDGGPTTVELFAPDTSEIGPLVLRNDGPDGGPISFRVLGVECTPTDLQGAIDDPEVLHAFYDLSLYPHTYDFAYFAMAAEIARHKAGLKTIHVHILRPGSKEAGRLPEGFHSAIGEDAREWRIYNVIIPILTLFPTIRGYSVLPDAAAAYTMREHLKNIYPRDLDPAAGAPIHVPYREVNSTLSQYPGALRPRATQESLRYIQQWLAPRAKGRKPLVITLRQYKFLPARNSNVEAWLTFAKEVDKSQYFPIIVPDTATALDSPPPEYGDIAVFPEAAFHLPLRMALYESAFMNLATTGGPPMLLTLSDRCAFLYFKHLVPGVRLCSVEHLSDVGFQVGKDLPHLKPNQHYVWEDDDLPVIRREFDAMVSRLSAVGDPRSCSG